MNPLQIPIQQLDAAIKAVMPVIVAKGGAIVVEQANEAFLEQGWTDTELEPWTPRKNQEAKDQGRAILVKTGRLRRSIRVVSTTADTVTIGSDVPYAKVHNEGYTGTAEISSYSRNSFYKAQASSIKTRRVRTVTGIASTHQVKAHTKQMRIVKRQFLGKSHRQDIKIVDMIEQEFSNALKQFK